jgi:hypothetical protein
MLPFAIVGTTIGSFLKTLIPELIIITALETSLLFLIVTTIKKNYYLFRDERSSSLKV